MLKTKQLIRINIIMSLNPRNNTLGSSASYHDFIKDIYSSLRNVLSNINTLNTKVDTLINRIDVLESKLTDNNVCIEDLKIQVGELISQSQTVKNSQICNGTSLLSQLDSLGLEKTKSLDLDMQLVNNLKCQKIKLSEPITTQLLEDTPLSPPELFSNTSFHNFKYEDLEQQLEYNLGVDNLGVDNLGVDNLGVDNLDENKQNNMDFLILE